MQRRNIYKEEIQAKEKEFDSLQLESNPRSSKRQYTKALSKFETYL